MAGQTESADLKVRVLSVQPAGPRGAWSGDPALHWKANLIALSQSESLYFIALNDTLHVDRPNPADGRFDQDQMCHIKWRLPTTPQAHKSSRHHNSRYPHGVNRLEICKLGEQEILVCACDDGDVVVYATASFQQVFDSVDQGMPAIEAVGRFLERPLFHFSVGCSAWGIAVHQDARIIAISSNKAEITVKAIAMASSPSVGADIPILRGRDGAIIDRATDHTWVLDDHSANIPALAFYRGKAQSSQLFLLSSDIDNHVFIWDVSSCNRLVCKINIEYSDLSRQYGWVGIPIGPETFRLVAHPNTLHGCSAHLLCDDQTNIVPAGSPSMLQEQTRGMAGSLSSTSQVSLQYLPFSLVHSSSERVTLLHKPFDRIASCFVAPWRQDAPPFLDHHGTPGTMKYAQHIPQLGIVIAGSDLGHVGIFTLTRLDQDDAAGNSLGMRLEHILPLPSQVSDEQRLVASSGWGPLIGLASAPMPGTIRGRFRLVLEYADRTLLTYELWRDECYV